MPPTPPPPHLQKRYPFHDDDDDHHRTGIKYGVLFGILVLVFLLILAMWYHARQRMRRGEGPLIYHRWLVPRPLRHPPFAPYPAAPSSTSYLEPQPGARPHPEHGFSFYSNNEPMPPPAYTPPAKEWAGELRGGEGSAAGGAVQRPEQAHTAPEDVPPPAGPPPDYPGPGGVGAGRV